MLFTVIQTSLQSNLFTDWNFLASIPWMRATLVDFYINTIVLFAWMAFRANSWVERFFWLILFVLLGSMATTLYVVIQLLKLKEDEPVRNAFIIKNTRK